MSERHAPPRIDVHVHLAGLGTGDSGCWMAERFQSRYTFRYLRRAFGITAERMRESADQDWAAMVARLVARSDLDHAVVLGFDGVYRADGELDPDRSQMIIPGEWVFEACGRHPGLLPGPSLNPFRKDALERLDECIERGAVLIKWLPIVQAIDMASPRLDAFYRRLADAGVPLLIHAGTGENVFDTVAPECGDLRLLVHPLEAGVSVICAHSAASIHLSRERDNLPVLRELLRRYPHLWVDNSGLANPIRFRHLPRLAADPEIAERTLHGSDFPVPTNAFYYVRQIGPRGVREIEREANLLQRDLLIKEALGFDAATFTRAADVLGNLERWVGRGAEVGS